MSHYENVKIFQSAIKKPFKSLDLDNQIRLKERAMLMAEEFQEVLSAMGFDSRVQIASLIEGTKSQAEPFYESTERAEELDKEHILKELCDITIMAMGTAAEFGFLFDQAMFRVHENNMAKVQGSLNFDENGKVIKPKNHPKPNLKVFV